MNVSNTCIHSAVARHLGCFQVGAARNNTAIHILVHFFGTRITLYGGGNK